MQGVHPETQHVAGFEIDGQPARSVLLLDDLRVVVEPGETVPVGVGPEVSGVQALRSVAVLEKEEGAFVPIDPPQRNPTGEDPVGTTVHVGPVTVESTPLSGPHEPGPAHVETADRTLEQRLVHGEDLGSIGHAEVGRARPDTLGERSQVRDRARPRPSPAMASSTG